MPKAQTKTKTNQQKGFTLIELMIVIIVITTLSGILIGVINREGIRGKARDAQRKADLSKIQLALETYFADNRSYPDSEGWKDTNDILANYLVSDYIDALPIDPLYDGSTTVSNPCDSLEVKRYNYNSSGPRYTLTAQMELETSNDDSPCNASICGGQADQVIYCFYKTNP